MEDTRRLTARGLGVLPLVLMGALHLTVPPLKGTFELEPLLMVPWYAVAMTLGVVLFRKSRVVRDHEYNRAKAMRSIQHVYKAEADGVWDREVALEGQLGDSPTLAMNQSVGSLAPETEELELGNDTKVQVNMLSGTLGMASSSSTTGPDNGPTVQRTLGAQTKVGPMDQLLDKVFGWFGRDTKAEREARRQARMLEQSRAAPVVAQRPVAPLRLNTQDDGGEVQMTSMSDSGGVETVITSRGSELLSETLPEPLSAAAQPTLEQMAQLQPATLSMPVPQARTCRGCGTSSAAGTMYCPGCGLDL